MNDDPYKESSSIHICIFFLIRSSSTCFHLMPWFEFIEENAETSTVSSILTFSFVDSILTYANIDTGFIEEQITKCCFIAEVDLVSSTLHRGISSFFS